TRTIEDAKCAACMKPCNCNIGIYGFVIASYTVGTQAVIDMKATISCGNYMSAYQCNPCWAFQFASPYSPFTWNVPTLGFLSPCYQTGFINCGQNKAITYSITG